MWPPTADLRAACSAVLWASVVLTVGTGLAYGLEGRRASLGSPAAG
jgi:hypothetical protein